MNWCKIGRHDDIVFNDYYKVIEVLTSILISYDYEKKESSGRYWFDKTLHVRDDMTIFDGKLESIFPERTSWRFPLLFTKVCVRCKRIKRSYKMIDLECKLITLIGKVYDAAEKQQYAKIILKDSFQ